MSNSLDLRKVLFAAAIATVAGVTAQPAQAQNWGRILQEVVAPRTRPVARPHHHVPGRHVPHYNQPSWGDPNWARENVFTLVFGLPGVFVELFVCSDSLGGQSGSEVFVDPFLHCFDRYGGETLANFFRCPVC